MITVINTFLAIGEKISQVYFAVFITYNSSAFVAFPYAGPVASDLIPQKL